MSEFKEYVNFYIKNGFWIYPFQGSNDVFDENYWSKLPYNKYLEELNNYDWESSKGISVVTGKNDICILHIESHPQNGYNHLLLKNIFKLLGLPEDYQWVVNETNSIYILLKVFGNISSETNIRYRRFSVISKRPYPLPPGGNYITNYKTHFKYGIPKTALAQVSKDTFYHCLEQMNTNDMVNNPMGEKGKMKMRLALGCLVLVIIILVTGFFVLVSGKEITFSLVLRALIGTIIAVALAAFIMKD